MDEERQEELDIKAYGPEDSEEDLVDFTEEIDLSDIFDDALTSGKTIVMDRAGLKEDLEEAEEEAREDEEDDFSDEFIDVDRQRKKHKKRHVFFRMGVTLVAAIVLVGLLLSPLFKIKNVAVEGNDYYSAEEIITMAEPRVGENIFLHAEKGRIRKALMKDPYFERVSVGRRLPGTLVIKVKEKEQLAALKYGDRYVVIDSDTRVLRTANIDPEVTIIEGLTISRMDVGEKIEVEEEATLEDTVATLDTMKDGDFYFKRIMVSKDDVEAYIYDMLKVEGSSEELRSAIESGNLQKVVNRLIKTKIVHGTVNLGEDEYISFSPSV